MKQHFPYISFLLGLICLMSSCKEKVVEVKEYNIEEGVEVKIISPAGEHSEHVSSEFLPPPFNIASDGNNNYNFIVLSSRMNKSKTLRVKPIAVVEMTDTIDHSYIVAIPADIKDQTISISNFGMLATNFPEVKNMIEYWLVGNQRGLKVRVSWKSEQKTLELID